MYLKWASLFWLSIQNFIFPQKKNCLVLGGWVVWPGGGGGGGQITPLLWISTCLVVVSLTAQAHVSVPVALTADVHPIICGPLLGAWIGWR